MSDYVVVYRRPEESVDLESDVSAPTPAEAVRRVLAEHPGSAAVKVWLDVTHHADLRPSGPAARSPHGSAVSVPPAEAASVWFHEGDLEVRLDVQPPADAHRRDLEVMRAVLSVATHHVSVALLDVVRHDQRDPFAVPAVPFPTVTPQY